MSDKELLQSRVQVEASLIALETSGMLKGMWIIDNGSHQ